MKGENRKRKNKEEKKKNKCKLKRRENFSHQNQGFIERRNRKRRWGELKKEDRRISNSQKRVPRSKGGGGGQAASREQRRAWQGGKKEKSLGGEALTMTYVNKHLCRRKKRSHDKERFRSTNQGALKRKGRSIQRRKVANLRG